MHKRLELHEKLLSILGSKEVYFQPPTSVLIKYPAIIYSRNQIGNNFADNEVYKQSHYYDITVIDANPESKIVETISKLPTCRFNRHFKSDNLNHNVFTIYY